MMTKPRKFDELKGPDFSQLLRIREQILLDPTGAGRRTRRQGIESSPTDILIILDGASKKSKMPQFEES